MIMERFMVLIYLERDPMIEGIHTALARPIRTRQSITKNVMTVKYGVQAFHMELEEINLDPQKIRLSIIRKEKRENSHQPATHQKDTNIIMQEAISSTRNG